MEVAPEMIGLLNDATSNVSWGPMSEPCWKVVGDSRKSAACASGDPVPGRTVSVGGKIGGTRGLRDCSKPPKSSRCTGAFLTSQDWIGSELFLFIGSPSRQL